MHTFIGSVEKVPGIHTHECLHFMIFPVLPVKVIPVIITHFLTSLVPEHIHFDFDIGVLCGLASQFIAGRGKGEVQLIFIHE